MCMESQTTMRNNWIDKSTNHGIIFPQITEKQSIFYGIYIKSFVN